VSTRLALCARLARITAAVGLASISVYLLFDVGLEPGAMGVASAKAPGRRLSLPLPPALEPPSDDDPLAPKPMTSAGADPPPSSRQILVDVGPPRSDVFVDGRRVGQTPFLGQVRCRPGREISIHVVPERGLPLQEKRVCPP
jgi:hypothetical protein